MTNSFVLFCVWLQGFNGSMYTCRLGLGIKLALLLVLYIFIITESVDYNTCNYFITIIMICILIM